MEMPNEVSKSYIPKSGEFVPAVQAGAKALRRAQREGRYGKTWPTNLREAKEALRIEGIRLESEARLKHIKRLGEPLKTTKLKNGRTVKEYEAPMPARNIGGYHLAEGGRRGTSHIVLPPAESIKLNRKNPARSLERLNNQKRSRAAVLSHEMAHARPTRPAHRAVSLNSSALGREEARADFESGRRLSETFKTPEFSGYTSRAKLPLRSRQTSAYLAQMKYREGRVAKSYVPGKGFVPASKLGATKLKRALGAGDGERKFIAGKDGVRVQTKPTKPKTNPYKSRGLDQTQRRALEAHQANTANFRLFAEHGRPIKSSKGVDAYRVPGLQQATGSHAMAWKTGGKKGKRIYAEDADAKATMTPKQHKQLRQHEESHTAPKSRTSWRLARVASDPKKIMREEARADMAGGTHYRRMRSDVRRVDRLERRVEKNPSAFLDASDKDMRALNRVTGESGYAQMASSGLARRRSTNQLTALASGSSRAAQELAEQKFSARSLREYRKTQNKIARAQGVRKALHMPNEVSKMSPDPSAVHVPGNARLVRRRNKDRKPKRPTSGM